MHAARYRFSITRASVYTRGGGGKVTSTTASVSTASGWRTQNAYFKTDAQIRDEQVQFASLPLEKKKKTSFNIQSARFCVPTNGLKYSRVALKMRNVTRYLYTRVSRSVQFYPIIYERIFTRHFLPTLPCRSEKKRASERDREFRKALFHAKTRARERERKIAKGWRVCARD